MRNVCQEWKMEMSRESFGEITTALLGINNQWKSYSVRP